MALMAGSHQLQQEGFLRHLTVAHLNHGLRDDCSTEDQKFVEESSGRLGISCIAEKLPSDWLSGRQGGSIEASAREERYRFLIQVAEKKDCGAVVTAHHQSDQAETVLHNLLRGSGIRGLRGIPKNRQLAEHIVCLRPMIRVSRRQIDNFISTTGIKFRKDATNEDRRFLRNRIRNELLPLIHREFNQQASQHLTALAEQADELLSFADSAAEDIIRRSVLETGADVLRLQRDVLCSTPEPILRHTMTVLWAQAGLPRANMNRQHWKRLVQAVRTGDPPGLTLPGRIQVTVTDHIIRLTRLDGDSTSSTSQEAP